MNSTEHKNIVERILKLISSENWTDCRKIVETDRDLLLTDKAVEILTEIISNAKKHHIENLSLDQHLSVISECKKRGIEEAFFNLEKVVHQSATSELTLFVILTELDHFQKTEQIHDRIGLITKAITLIDRERGPELWASLQVDLGHCFLQIPEEDNIEKSIHHLQQGLEVFTLEFFPEEHLKILNDLAKSYLARTSGNRAENIDFAISNFEKALQSKSLASPQDEAEIQNNLAVAYLKRLRGKSEENVEVAIGLFRKALLVRTLDEFPEKWAMLQLNLGTAFIQRMYRDRKNNIEQAIAYLHNALMVYTRDAFPEDWAAVQNTLGVAFSMRVLGEIPRNLKTALEHYQCALKVRTRESLPNDWAKTNLKLAEIYLLRIDGNLENNIERAITLIKQTLEVLAENTYPGGWAFAEIMLAKAYRQRIKGTRTENLQHAISRLIHVKEVINQGYFPEELANAHSELGICLITMRHAQPENIEKAIDSFQQALFFFTETFSPEKWATIMKCLGDAYRYRLQDDHASNLEKAITHYQQSLEITLPEIFPDSWSETQNLLALAYVDRILGERAENIEQAINLLRQVIEIISRDLFPVKWALTQNNLGSTYRLRIRGDRSDNLEKSIHHHNLAHEIFEREKYPEEWAASHLKLANVYRIRIVGERADNIEKGIHHLEQALEIYSFKKFPFEWALVQNNLGNAYRDRMVGDRAENIDLAIEYLQRALQFRTRTATPEDWAMTQNNLANAYHDRLKGRRELNLESAIKHQDNALEVYTRNSYPEEWAKSKNNLATVYTERIFGDHADNQEVAIKVYQESLEVYTPSEFPEYWAGVQHNMGTVFADRINGNRANNVEIAIGHYSNALQIRTRGDFPILHFQTEKALGDLLFDEGRWEQSFEAYDSAINAGKDLLVLAYSEVGRHSIVANSAKLFLRASYCLFQMKRLGDALVMLERGKTRLLNEALALAKVDIKILSENMRNSLQNARMTIRLLEAELRLSSSKRPDRALLDRLRTQRAELNDLIDQIRATIPQFMPTELNLNEILEAIPKDTLLLAPLITSKGSITFVVPYGTTEITVQNIVSMPEIKDDDINELLIGSDQKFGWLQAYETYKRSRDLTNWKSSIEKITEQLWDSIISPVYEILSKTNVNSLLILASGGLQLLPFHAAWRQDANGQKRALVDDYIITYAPSMYVLSTARNQIKEPQCANAVVAGINNYPNNPLFYAVPEAKVIANILNTTPLLDDSATKTAVKTAIPGAAFLHFCCHGLFNLTAPSTSAIYLANSEPLTVSEIMSDLDLSSARLVGLSACETGMSDFIKSPGEFIGLPTAFLQVGAPAVLCSLWSVDDRSTALLMQRFYINFVEKRFSASAALREAQVWLSNSSSEELDHYFRIMKLPDPDGTSATLTKISSANDSENRPYANPFYWAAFTLNGAGI